MRELLLKQPKFTDSACGLFTSEKIQNFRERGNLKHLYGNELNKFYFAHDSAYSDSKENYFR